VKLLQHIQGEFFVFLKFYGDALSQFPDVFILHFELGEPKTNQSWTDTF
jgi:hypothetical protein